VRLERYVKDIEIEVEALRDLAQTSVLPAAYKQQIVQSESMKSYLEAARLAGFTPKPLSAQSRELESITELIALLPAKLNELAQKSQEGARMESLSRKAHYYAYELMPACAEVREACDRLEERIDNELWPLPKYHEMLFLS